MEELDNDRLKQLMTFAPFNFPEYKGRNKFIKKLIAITGMTYFGITEGESHQLILGYNGNPFQRIAGLKLNELGKKNIELYLVAVHQEYRKSGLGTDIMQRIINCSNDTGFTITLTPSNIYNAHLKDVVGALAITKKNKIKVNDLKNWYKKFGFVTKGKDKEGKIIMEYTPAT